MVDTFPGKAGSVLSEGKGIEMIAWFVPGQKTLFLSRGSSGKKKKKSCKNKTYAAMQKSSSQIILK